MTLFVTIQYNNGTNEEREYEDIDMYDMKKEIFFNYLNNVQYEPKFTITRGETSLRVYPETFHNDWIGFLRKRMDPFETQQQINSYVLQHQSPHSVQSINQNIQRTIRQFRQ